MEAEVIWIDSFQKKMSLSLLEVVHVPAAHASMATTAVSAASAATPRAWANGAAAARRAQRGSGGAELPGQVADVRYTAVADIRQVSELRAEARCTAPARAALGDAVFKALRVQAGSLAEQAVDELAWQMPSAPGSACSPSARA